MADGAGLDKGPNIGANSGSELSIGLGVEAVIGLYEGLNVGTVAALLTHSLPNS